MTTKKFKNTEFTEFAEEIKKCREPCISLRKGSRERQNCIEKNCEHVVNKIVNKLLPYAKKCNSLKKGSRKYKNCMKKTVRKILPKKRKTKKRKTKKRKERKHRGGYGPGTPPFIGSPWNATGSAYYYPYNTDGIGPGGTPVFPGNNSPSPQHGGSGGLMQQLAINPYRGAIGGLGNLANVYNGRSLAPSPYPQYQDTLLS